METLGYILQIWLLLECAINSILVLKPLDINLNNIHFFIVCYSIKKFIVQLQTFTTSDYLFSKNCFDNNELQNRKKYEKYEFYEMDINCNALSKLFGDFCNLSLPALGVESVKTVLLLFHDVFSDKKCLLLCLWRQNVRL